MSNFPSFTNYAGEPPIYENKGPYVFDRKYKRVGVEFEVRSFYQWNNTPACFPTAPPVTHPPNNTLHQTAYRTTATW